MLGLGMKNGVNNPEMFSLVLSSAYTVKAFPASHTTPLREEIVGAQQPGRGHSWDR